MQLGMKMVKSQQIQQKEIQSIINAYFKNVYSNNMENREKWTDF